MARLFTLTRSSVRYTDRLLTLLQILRSKCSRVTGKC